MSEFMEFSVLVENSRVTGIGLTSKQEVHDSIVGVEIRRSEIKSSVGLQYAVDFMKRVRKVDTEVFEHFRQNDEIKRVIVERKAFLLDVASDRL
jgi:hypothetical protein